MCVTEKSTRTDATRLEWKRSGQDGDDA